MIFVYIFMLSFFFNTMGMVDKVVESRKTKSLGDTIYILCLTQDLGIPSGFIGPFTEIFKQTFNIKDEYAAENYNNIVSMIKSFADKMRANSPKKSEEPFNRPVHRSKSTPDISEMNNHHIPRYKCKEEQDSLFKAEEAMATLKISNFKKEEQDSLFKAEEAMATLKILNLKGEKEDVIFEMEEVWES